MALSAESSKKIVAESLTMITTALGLVAALAWNEAIKALIEEVLPKGKGVISLFIYALLVTGLGVVLSFRILKLRQRFERQEKASQ